MSRPRFDEATGPMFAALVGGIGVALIALGRKIGGTR